MTWLNTMIILAAAFLAVFWQAAFHLVRHVLGAQIDLLPALMVYASLTARFETVCLLAIFSGLLLDSLSANPLGISVLPLFTVGVAIFSKRELILRDQAFAQLVLGLIAGAVCPAISLILLLTMGYSPLLGWVTLWQLTVMALGGAFTTPVIFALFDWLQRTLIHTQATETSFRADREIRRGR